MKLKRKWLNAHTTYCERFVPIKEEYSNLVLAIAVLADYEKLPFEDSEFIMYSRKGKTPGWTFRQHIPTGIVLVDIRLVEVDR